MEAPKLSENLPRPPGIINSIKAGFDAIAAHISAILFPIILDLFLWLGPRLRMDVLFNSFIGDVTRIWQTGGIPAKDIQTALDLYKQTIPTVNLFWFLRTIPIGISSLLYPEDISQTPLGFPSILQVGLGGLFGWMVLLTLIGWIGGGLYYRSVAWFATKKEESPIRVSRAIWQTVFISVFWLLLVIIIGTPIFLLLALLVQVNELIVNIAILLLSLVSMWVIVPLFFWPHGVFLKKQNAITSIISSVQMTRFTLPTSSMFVLTFFLLTIGLNFLWSIPPKDSWMTLVGILGHAFVTTALLAGSFIYYRDMNVWLQLVIERLRANVSNKQARLQ